MEYHIWIEGEYTAQQEWIDVVVTFPSRQKWVATFCTPHYIASQISPFHEHRRLSDAHYLLLNRTMIVPSVSRLFIERFIDYLFVQDEFFDTFIYLGTISDAEAQSFPIHFFSHHE